MKSCLIFSSNWDFGTNILNTELCLYFPSFETVPHIALAVFFAIKYLVLLLSMSLRRRKAGSRYGFFPCEHSAWDGLTTIPSVCANLERLNRFLFRTACNPNVKAFQVLLPFKKSTSLWTKLQYLSFSNRHKSRNRY